MAKRVSKGSPSAAKKDELKKRKLEKPVHKSFRLQKRIKHPSDPIVSSFKLMKGNIRHLLKHKRLFGGITLIYFIASLVLVTGLGGSTDYTLLRDSLNELFTGKGAQLGTGLTLFGMIVGNGTPNNGTQTAGLYQSLLIAIISLVTIWALRQTYAKVKTNTKEAFYKSMTPLVPFILVGFVVALQFVPLLAGSLVYATVAGQGLAITLAEQFLWILLVATLAALSLYMVSSSIFALYIVTLPDVTPMKALRSARELVRYRRWSVMRKFILLPFFLLIVAGLIMVPVLLFATSIAQLVYILLTMFGLIIVHGYVYRLYRELL